MTSRPNMGIYRKFQSSPFNKTSYEIITFRDMYNLDAPYQRGNVWGVERQRKLIESMMLGIPIGTVIINRRHWLANDDRYQVVDGKQRITAIWDFVDGKYGVPAEWFGDCAAHLCGLVTYDDLPDRARRMVTAMSVPVVECNLDGIDEESELFDRVNFAGVPQGASDFA